MSDGSLIFGTKIDSSGAEKDMVKLKVKLEKATNAVGKQIDVVAKLEAELKKLQSMQAPTEEYAQLEQAFQKADAKLQGLIDRQDKFLATGGSTSGAAWESLQYDIEKTATEVRAYQAQMDMMKARGSAFTKDSSAVTDLSAKLNAAKIKMDELRLKEQEAGAALKVATIPVAGAVDSAAAAVNRFSKRLSNTLKSALVFSVLYKALSIFKTYMSSALKTNDEFAASLAQLKGAFLTAFQPIFEAIVPALIVLMNVLTAVISAIAKFFALLSGKGLSSISKSAEAMNDEANAISGAGGAAKDASKSMASFDEINQLQDNSASAGGGGVDASVSPSFEGLDAAADKFKLIKDLVLAIAAGLLVWKIASIFTKSLSIIGGLALAIGGAILLVKGYWDAWTNGIDTTNLIEMLGGLTLVAVGLGIAFGGIAAAIALLVGGIEMLVLGIKEWITTGELSTKTFLAIEAGIIAVGIALALLFGWPALVIAAIVAAALAIYKYWDEIKAFFIALWDNIKEIFNTAWEAIKGVFSVVAEWFVTDVIEPIKSFFQPLIDWFGDLFEGCWLIIQAIWIIVSTWFNITVVQPLINFFAPVVKTIGGFFSKLWEDVKLVWRKVSEWFSKYVIEPIQKAWETAFEAMKAFVKGVFNGIIVFFETIINGIIAALNFFMSGFNTIATAAGKIVGKDYSGVGMISEVSIPRLAAGAVIPANREFLAVLGDQKSGNNIEVPEALLRKIVSEEGGGKNITIEFKGSLAQLARILEPEIKQETKRKGLSLAGG